MYSLESTNARYNDQLDFILPTEGSNANSHTLILARNHHGRNIMFGLGHQGPECFQTFAGVDCLCSSHACKSRERKANSPRRLKTIGNGRPCRSPDYSQHLAIQRHTMQHMQAGKIPETPSTIIWPQSLGFGWRKSWLFFCSLLSMVWLQLGYVYAAAQQSCFYFIAFWTRFMLEL